ncbi:Na+/H+ antiporter NhaC family protein [Aliikangiella coralliicola]|uniref:Sodium:proton antiporter n=1 Tax=Aliikangiella coralliicola TaxID=2592383 RepID=A0A545UCI4_9GAMM|nr:Na+/H+ antiporter NhaC family protein [Aliikangiella coralliicola]TQV87175.1 sodium:proton antiporter [Aliikangiella coralliicola]
MFNKNNGHFAIAIFVIGFIASLFAFSSVSPIWKEQALLFDVKINAQGQPSYRYKGKDVVIDNAIPYKNSPLRQAMLDKSLTAPSLSEQWVYKIKDNGEKQYLLLKPAFHLGLWSLLPAFITIALCLLTKEPMSSLFAGIAVGAVLIGKFDITDKVLLPTLSSTGAATIILLYLWLLGGLLGIWSKTGAAQAFADFMCRTVVKGPKSAKLVTWFLGVIFFQGGSISTVLVGTTVKPLADKAKVSHEETSYVVDSTASPIASILAFNPWPAYVQALIYIPGVAFLATEADRIRFFFQSIPFSFYSILAVLGTLLLSLNITTFSGKGIRKAMKRANETGELDGPDATPLNFQELKSDSLPEGYKPHHLEFIFPILLLISIAIISFIVLGIPKINWAFAAALGVSILIAGIKGMRLRHIIDGIGDGLKSVVSASVILMLAVTIGRITTETGGGLFLIDLLGSQINYQVLPAVLMLFTMITAFSTGTSWGTYAIAFPLAMPLVWAIAQSQGLAHPELFLSICFAAVLNGSVFGDQCSPISDTTVLSAMTTGCDLMDHVKTQIIPASIAAGTATLLWSLITIVYV